jgi:hypothetical protein
VQEILNNVYRNDKVSEIVNDSDLRGSGFSEISNGDTCRVEYNPIASNEKLFSLIILMSVLRMSSLRDYWSLCPVIHTTCAVSVQMSQDRFLALLTIF